MLSLITFIIATCCCSLQMFCESFRIGEDLSAGVRFGDKNFECAVVFREYALFVNRTRARSRTHTHRWNDEVPDRPEMEFRGFVHNKKLNALTQALPCFRFCELLMLLLLFFVAFTFWSAVLHVLLLPRVGSQSRCAGHANLRVL